MTHKYLRNLFQNFGGLSNVVVHPDSHKYIVSTLMMCFILSRDPDESVPVELRILAEAVGPKIFMDGKITEDSRFVGWTWTPKIQTEIYLNHLNYQTIPFANLPPPKKNLSKEFTQKPCLPKNLHRNLNPKNPRTFQFVSPLVSLVKSRNHGGVSMVYTTPFGWVEASVPHSAAVRLEDPSGQVGLFTVNSTYNHRESKPRIPESKALFKAFINHHGPKKIIPFNKAWVFLRGG